ncbi:protein FAM107B-like [Oppia nitens]|uniref:protein FAM107B-like n=1 Tax=Oppia nitens TaxID=1686743 RepID=UPI0023D99386|nr:protein FAM107B-like [Oppia nitens]
MIPEPDYRDDDNYKNNNNNGHNGSHTSSLPTPMMRHHQRNGSPNHKMNGNGVPVLPNLDEEGLVIPRKLVNPCLESNERMSIHKEMLWNQKVGKNVLNGKNELQKELAKRKDNQKRKELEAEKLSRRSSLERRLEEQQLKIKQHEQSSAEHTVTSTSGSSSPDKQSQESEFLKIYSKVKSATNSDYNNDTNGCAPHPNSSLTNPKATSKT